MHILSRRLYNGGFNHLRRRTGTLLLGVPRLDPQPLQVRLVCTPRQDPQVNKSPESSQPWDIQSYLNSHSRSVTSVSAAAANMSAHGDWVEHNTKYVAAFGEKKDLPLPPAKKLAIVSCMDARINVYAELGINEGDAHIIRNAGGSAKDALRSLIISQRLLGTRQIAVFHHTDCGMLTFTSSQLRSIVKDSDPGNKALEAVDNIDFLEFPELEQSVKDDVEYLQTNPLLLPETTVSGWIYDVSSGKIRQVV
jgi:carbonic anhydrase